MPSSSRRVLLCIPILLFAAACDGAVVIEGEAESATGGALERCEAVLFRADGDELGRRPVEPDLSATFTVTPGEREYFAEVVCEDHTAYRSNSFSSDARLGDPPVQLGKILIEPSFASGESHPPGGVPGSPSPPFSTLDLEPLHSAVALLESLERDPTAAGARRELAGLYLEAGYQGASRFFENTLRIVDGESAPLAPRVSSTSWGGGERELAQEVREIAHQAADLVGELRYREAVTLTATQIEQDGSTLLLAAEWARAVLSLRVFSPEDISPEAAEVAVRVLLTGVEEQLPLPIGMISRASGYALLAKSFLIAGDRVSAHTAASLALQDLESGVHPEWSERSVELMRELLEETR